jgi:peptidyl-prolyl cis-trans isomerase SurA
MILFAVAFVISSAAPTFAQEGEVTVIDEVVAQVNDDVITLSMLKREIKERIDTLKQEKKMTDAQANEEVVKHQAELIATLVNERLLLQKGKELDLANEIEAEVNSRMLQIAREQGINSIEKLYEAMRQSGIDPVAVRETMRAEMTKQAVIQQEVDRKLYLGYTSAAVKAYFDAHPDQFRKPESVTISEIWLSSGGKDDAAVRARATELVAQLRAGADFKAVAGANSEREKNGVRTAVKDGGLVGPFDVPSLREDLQATLKAVPAGSVTDPIKTPDGYQIIRVDARTPAGNTPTFNDNLVRQAMLAQDSEKEREAYLTKLRTEAFIKVSDTYSDGVMPLLKLNVAKAAKESDKDKKKKNAYKIRNSRFALRHLLCAWTFSSKPVASAHGELSHKKFARLVWLD